MDCKELPVTFKVECDCLRPKPRMTSRDRWSKREATDRWWAFKDMVVLSYRQAGGRFYTPPVSVKYEFFLSNRRRIDLDNLIKGINDALNNIAWPDDCCACVREYESAKAVFIGKGNKEYARISIKQMEE